MRSSVVRRFSSRAVALSVVAFMLLVPVYGFMEVSANPIVIGLVDANHTMTLSSGLSMPSASVNITISPVRLSSQRANLTVDVSCAFLISSNATQNSTVAFAYPLAWDAPLENGGVESTPFSISVNGSSTAYSIMTWDEVSPSLNLTDTWDWLEGELFAAVNISFAANSSIILGVAKTIHYTVSIDNFEFRYTIGTAASWDGDVSETIMMNITDTTPFASYSFSPTPDQTFEGPMSSASAIWELTSFPYDADWVGVYFRIAGEPFDFLFELDPGLVVMAIILCIVLVLYLMSPIRRRGLP